LIYLDSCLVIYLVENHAQYGPNVRDALARHAQETFSVSQLVRLECLVAPRRLRDSTLETAYTQALKQFRILPLSDQVYDHAIGLRAEHGLRTPDALHVACAQAGGCTALWTNDRRLDRAAGGFVQALADLGPR
jgi:predicted nucleic acid-binding protein